MSFFSSTLGVVCPALFPLGTGSGGRNRDQSHDPVHLHRGRIPELRHLAVLLGGSLVLGSCATEEERNAMFPRLLFLAVPASVLAATAYNFFLSLFL